MYSFLRKVLAGGVLLGAAAVLRGQITEWPATVAPGHFLLEMDALSLSIDHEDGARYTAVGAASTFLTTGLTANWDIQVGAELFLSQKYDDGSFTERHSGVGDIYVRTKWRFYEDAASGTSVALLPYVKFPTNSGGVGNDSVEGGVIVPWQTKLWGDFECSAMVELDFLRNDADDGYDMNWYASAAVTRTLTKAVGIYGEVAMGKSSGGGSFDGLLGGGVTLAFSDHAWWDFAVYRGLSRDAADWNEVVRFNYSF
ncbi:MAG: transporter [Oleiharenicola lentus]